MRTEQKQKEYKNILQFDVILNEKNETEPLSKRCKVEVGTGCLPEQERRAKPEPRSS